MKKTVKRILSVKMCLILLPSGLSRISLSSENIRQDM